jgi:hypothetical protein
MSIDYIVLWILVTINTLAILLIIRQVAGLPQVARPLGPKRGSLVIPWSLEALDGSVRRAAELPADYTLLFVSSTCEPCLTLFAEMRRVGRPPGPLYLVAQGDADAIAKEAESANGVLYDLLLRGGAGDLYQQLAIPGTPYAVAVREGRVAGSAAAPTSAQLIKISESALPHGRATPLTN